MPTPDRPDRTERLTGVVSIVGAGPVGLACALRLSTFGIRSVVLEAEPALRKRGSKACCIQGDVVEILDKCGCADAVVAEGLAWHVARTYVGGRERQTIVFPQPVGFPAFVNISQFRTEQILLDQLQRTAGALSEVRWSHTVTGLEHREDSVVVEASTPAGIRRLELPYLVACDGIHSAVRKLSGVEWTGYSHGDRFLITDIRARLPLAHERHFHYDPPFNPGRQLIMHAQPDDVWRIDWQLPPDVDIDAERNNGQLDARIRAVIGSVPYEIDWLSTYRFHQRVVARMRLGPLFFAGDAAHALPPYGARGMNSGIQDVDNLAWKLDLVMRGLAGDDLLETYHTERHAAARENLRITESTIRFMVPPGPLRRLGRNALLGMAKACQPLAHYVNSGKMAEPHAYTDSPILDPGKTGSPLSQGGKGGKGDRKSRGASGSAHSLVGCFAPDGIVSVPPSPRGAPEQTLGSARARAEASTLPGGMGAVANWVDGGAGEDRTRGQMPPARPARQLRFRQLVGEQFVVVYFASGLDDAYRFVEAANAPAYPVPLQFVVCLPGPPGIARAIGPASIVHDDSGALMQRYGATFSTWYLLRPDGHIAAAGDAERTPELGDVVRRCTGQAGTRPGARPETQSGVQPGAQSGVQPGARSGTRSAPRRGAAAAPAGQTEAGAQ